MTNITVTIDVPATMTVSVAKHPLTVDMAKVAAESLAYCLSYGIRRGLNDPANAAAKVWRDMPGAGRGKDDKWDISESEFYLTALYDGSLAKKARTAGGSTLDPVAETARQLAMADIVARLGVKTWAEAAAHEKGQKYVQIKVAKSGKEWPERQDSAVDDYIARFDAAAKDPATTYMARAETIVNAKITQTIDESEFIDL